MSFGNIVGQLMSTRPRRSVTSAISLLRWVLMPLQWLDSTR